MIGSLIYIIIIVLIIYLILKFVKKLISMIFSFILLFLVISFILVSFVYMDFSDLKENITNQTSIIILKDDIKPITGAYVIFNESFDFETKKLIENIGQSNLNNKKQILNKSYKLFIFDIKFLEENLPNNLYFNNITLSKNAIINILISEDPLLEFSSSINIQKDQIALSKNELKFNLFHITLNEITQNKNIGPVIKGYKNKQITIYRETIAFKFMKILPSAYINNYFTN